MKKVIFILLLLIIIDSLNAQVLEPKLYDNAPVGLNILIVGVAHTEGAIPENAIIGLENPDLTINSAVFAYGRVFDFLGRNTKFDINIPYSYMDGTAEHEGEPVSRKVSGFGDTKARVSFNLFGGPALSLQEFLSYEQDIIVGVSLQVTIPTGQYDSSKLINVSTHRWALKPGIGISKSISNYTFEFSADAEFFTSNDDFYGGVKITQDPIYSAQVHVLYTFRKAMWLSVGSTYYWGGEIYTNGSQPYDTRLNNSRLGGTFSYPINNNHAIKIYGNRGINIRYGSDFDGIGIVWQYSWMD